MDGIRRPAFSRHLSHGRFPLNIVDAVIHGAAVLRTGRLPAHKLTRPDHRHGLRWAHHLSKISLRYASDRRTPGRRGRRDEPAGSPRMCVGRATVSHIERSPLEKSTLPMG